MRSAVLIGVVVRGEGGGKNLFPPRAMRTGGQVRAPHCPPRYSSTHRLAGRRRAHRPDLRPRGPLRRGAVPRAHLRAAVSSFQNREQARCNLHAFFPPHLTRSHFPPCPTTRHRICLSRTRKRHAHTHAPATHTLRSLCVRVSCFLRATVCNVHLIPTAAWRDTASGRENLREE